jgi:hypothetical protein
VVVLLNSAGTPAALTVTIPASLPSVVDVLNGDERFSIQNGRLQVEIPAGWGRILRLDYT